MTWLSRELFHSPVTWALCTTEARYHKALRRIGETDEEPWLSPQSKACVQRFKRKGYMYAFICIRPRGKYSRNQLVTCLAHECVHVWQEIRDWMGTRPPGREFEAYSIERLLLTALTEYDRQIAEDRAARKPKRRRRSRK